MLNDELVKTSPLRQLDADQQGLLPVGRLGLVVAPPGTGKTAFLVQLALDTLLRGESVLHLGVADKLQRIQSWYDELLTQLAGGKLSDSLLRLRAELRSRRLIITFKRPANLVERLVKRLQQLDEQNILQPTLVAVDGLDGSKQLTESLGKLAGVAAERNLRLWVSLRREAAAARSELPDEQLTAGAVVVYLEPTAAAVKLHLAKAPDMSARPQPVLLDPRTLLLQ